MTSGSGWLVLTTTAGNAIASGTNETTGFSFLAYANPTGLAAGTYVASITVTPAGGSTLSIPVTLTVTGGSTVSATPSSLNFSYQVGGSNRPRSPYRRPARAGPLWRLPQPPPAPATG